ncbi:putative glutamine synthetase, partial [Rhodotorula diobovata]
LEVRVPGADMNPYLTFASLLALGQRGIRQQLALPGPPVGPRTDRRALERLPRSLDRAVERMLAEGSRAREVLGRETVEHLGATRQNEWELFSQAVTDWEMRRYLELA